VRSDLNPDGWICWPEREDLSLEFMRLLAAAQEGGSTVSECWLTASHVDFTDDDSWYQEWSKTADVNNDRGFAAFAAGNLVTARSNWLRALNYYSAAAYPVDLAPDKPLVAMSAMRECAANYLRHSEPRGEVVSIPWLSEFALQGYYLPARATNDPAPVVICIGEPGHRKEEYLFKLARHAFERGISLLAVDVLGDGTGLPYEQLVQRQKLESAIEPIMDYLVGRDDVDEGRIAILADGWSSSFVARGIAFDPRFAAAVCDGGIWDLHERAFLKQRTAPAGSDTGCSPETSRILRSISCPLLITVGERGWLMTDRVAELADQLGVGRRDVTLKIFEQAETAAAQGHMDNPTLANEFIFDWIASRLGTDSRSSGHQSQESWKSNNPESES
jgi:pimeloyl-ACP methyl ester carboxylesterase